MNWLPHFLGIDNETGRFYAFWSGFGSDIGEVAIIGGLISVYRRHNCEVHGCWRLGRHATAAGHMVCRVHHPDGHLTPGGVVAAHETARERLHIRRPHRGTTTAKDAERVRRAMDGEDR